VEKVRFQHVCQQQSQWHQNLLPVQTLILYLAKFVSTLATRCVLFLICKAEKPKTASPSMSPTVVDVANNADEKDNKYAKKLLKC
jgi:hypothetical protein